MWYGIVRLAVIFVPIFVLRKIYIKKKDQISKLFVSVSFILAILLSLLLSCAPFEDLFITFSSPEAAYHYSREGSIDAVVEGEESTMMLDFRGSETKIAIFPKSKTGWKLGSALTDINSRSIRSDYFIVLYSYNRTDDYYVLVSESPMDNIYDITDNKGTQFEKHIEEFDQTDIKDTTYYSYIKDYDDDYGLIINGEKINFDD